MNDDKVDCSEILDADEGLRTHQYMDADDATRGLLVDELEHA